MSRAVLHLSRPNREPHRETVGSQDSLVEIRGPGNYVALDADEIDSDTLIGLIFEADVAIVW